MVDNLEESLLVLYNSMISLNISDDTIWSAFFEMAIQLDMQIHSDICGFLEQEIVNKIVENQNSERFQSIYLILLNQTCQLHPILRYVTDRLLQNSRGFLKDEIFYSNFTENLMDLWSMGRLSSDAFSPYCECIPDLSASFIRILASFFSSLNGENFSVELSDHGIITGEEEEMFWSNLIRYERDYETKNDTAKAMFKFLHSCFLHSNTVRPVRGLNDCFCNCHKHRWITTHSKYTKIDEDWRRAFVRDLGKLEKLVRSTSANAAKSGNLKFDIIAGDNWSQSSAESTERVLPKIEETINADERSTPIVQNDDASLETSSEWSIRNSSNRSFPANEIKNAILKDVVVDLEFQKHKDGYNNSNKNDNLLNEEESFSSEHGKTESSIESIPFDDEPDQIRSSSVHEKNDPVESGFRENPPPALDNIRFLKFEFDAEDEDDDANEFDAIGRSIISQRDNTGFMQKTGFSRSDANSLKFKQYNDGDDDSTRRKISTKLIDATDANVFRAVDKAVSPIATNFSCQSIFVQTDEIDNENSVEEKSRTKVSLKDTGIGTEAAKGVDFLVKLEKDQATQTICATKKNISNLPNKNHFLYVENMNATEIQNVCKLAQTFSTIC